MGGICNDLYHNPASKCDCVITTIRFYLAVVSSLTYNPYLVHLYAEGNVQLQLIFFYTYHRNSAVDISSCVHVLVDSNKLA